MLIHICDVLFKANNKYAHQVFTKANENMHIKYSCTEIIVSSELFPDIQ